MTTESTYYSAHVYDNSLAITRTRENTAPVVAAGALVWRLHGEKLEVLMIHRPRYNDWSWPKGKQDAGESLVETAIREVDEEVTLRITLGVPLAVTNYMVSGRPKDVFYWAAQLPVGEHPRADEGEVDEIRWVTPKEARKLLSNSTDHEPLDALVAHHKAGTLHTRPVVIMRHAKAKPRSNWTAADDERPLAGTGKRQALAHSRLLEAYSPTRLLSSPWLRCMQTVAPYANDHAIAIKEKKSLSESGAAGHPKRTAKVTESLFVKEVPSLLCTHRPVLPLVFKALKSHLMKGSAKILPTEDPYMEPGDAVVLQVSTAEHGGIVSVETIRPVID